MATSLANILSDPNYINANEATKRAIFDRYAPQDPNYANANSATQEAIRVKFGVAIPAHAAPAASAQAAPAAPAVEAIPGPRAAPPAWASEYPGMYRAAVAARQLAGPTAEMLGGVLGGVAGGAAGTFGAGPIGTLTGATIGSGLGYGVAKQGLRGVDVALGLQPPDTLAGEFQRAATGVGEGIGYEMAGRGIVAPVANKLVELGAKGAGVVMDVTQLPNRLAAKTARQALGSPEKVAAARAAMQEAEGLNLTAQQALARSGIISPSTQATLEKAVKKTGAIDTRATIEAAQEAARKSTIQGITPDLEAAVKARAAAAKPFYEAADKAVVPIDTDLSGLISRMPEGTLGKAAEIAKMEGRPFIMGKAAPGKMVEMPGQFDMFGKPVMVQEPGKTAEITGESLHYIKRALSDLAYGPTASTGAGRDAQLAARGLLKEYVSAVETKIPAYGEARRVFSEKSAPVNQAQVLREMVSVLEKPGGGERIGPFLNVLGRGEEAMLKRAGGRGGPRFEALSEVLTPEQIAKVREVARQLETEAAVGQQITLGQQRATAILKDELPQFRLPNIFNVLATTANRVFDTLSGRVGKKTMEKLAQSSLSAKSFDDLLATLPGEERSKVLKAISDPSTWAAIKPATGKAIMGAVASVPTAPPINQLAPEAETTNALAR